MLSSIAMAFACHDPLEDFPLPVLCMTFLSRICICFNVRIYSSNTMREMGMLRDRTAAF